MFENWNKIDYNKYVIALNSKISSDIYFWIDIKYWHNDLIIGYFLSCAIFHSSKAELKLVACLYYCPYTITWPCVLDCVFTAWSLGVSSYTPPPAYPSFIYIFRIWYKPVQKCRSKVYRTYKINLLELRLKTVYQ